MNVKINLRLVTKNHTADSKIGSPLKIDFRADWTPDSLGVKYILRLMDVITMLLSFHKQIKL